jgi:tetratricopeptide (TPR) repeat protein
MTENGEFTGFIGAQATTLSAWDIIWRRFQTDDQKDKTTSAIVIPYNNITLAGDFIYATIELDEGKVQSAIQNKDKSGTNAPVKMLNAAGSELMRRNGFYPPSGEVDFFGAINAMTGTNKIITGPSKIIDVAVGPENTWSIIDNKRSKVFTYDFDGNLLFAFGDQGDLLGNIAENALRAIDYQGDAMLLLDSSDKCSFTVYQRTEYGDVIMQALENQNNRRYDAAIDDWTEILKRNSNFDTAYIGIGNALARLHKYEEAVEQYKLAYDTANYSIAYSELRQEWISNYLWTLPIIAFVICFAIVKFLGYAKKVNKRVSVSAEKRTYGQELLFAFHLIMHPFDGFWDLKHEKRGSVRAGTTILAATIAVFYYDSIGAGYVTNPQATYGTIFGAITGVAVPLALWIIANWCLTTLFEGEGSMKDIYIASTYSLLPLILTMIPATIASNFILANEVKTVSLITTIGLVWMGLLLFFGTMVTHDYTIGKNVITVLATLVGMICIMFIAILFSTLLGKLVSFVTNIVTELRYRM